MTDKPLRRSKRRGASGRGDAAAGGAGRQRFRRLPGGSHGLDPEQVRRDQRDRLRAAMVELIATKGYPAVRISDLARLAHVSPPTLYSLYSDKQQLFLGTYDEIAGRTTEAILASYDPAAPPQRRLEAALGAFAELGAREPQAVSLLVLGALGAGDAALERRHAVLERLERFIHANRDPDGERDAGDLTVRALLGGIREVTAARLRAGRQRELPSLAERLAGWAELYPVRLPGGLAVEPPGHGERPAPAGPASQRSRRPSGRLPSGRSELPRRQILNSQRERIVDATAAIVAEKGLAGLTIPEIARRASVSHETFYSIYASKQEAVLGAQKVGMHQALRVTAEAYERCDEDWPQAIAAGLRALLDYLASEPAHARLTVVDTFATSPDAIGGRQAAVEAFGAYLRPGFELACDDACEPVPTVAAEAIVGGIWQVLQHYIESGSTRALPELAPQLTYFALAPFVGARPAADTAMALA